MNTFSNITDESIYSIKVGDKLEILRNKKLPDTDILTVSNLYKVKEDKVLGFFFEGYDMPKGWIMCRIIGDEIDD